MKILINTPDIYKLGGVANHYKGLKNFWSQEVHYNFIGGRKGIPGLVILIYDYLKFISICAYKNYDLLVLNPSLGKTAIKRDALFLKIAKRFKIKTVVFFHGWDETLAKEIDQNPSRFLSKYKKADGLIVLANQFKLKLKQWGVEKDIYLTTTKVDDHLLGKFDISNKNYNKNILFLARVEREKGIFIAIKSFKKVLDQVPDAKLTIVGDGNAMAEAKKMVASEKIDNIKFKGQLDGSELVRQFEEADLYLFPTYYGEGMPTSLLEAMAFGLPIISRPVGGINDFFQPCKMGVLIANKEVNEFAAAIKCLLQNQELMKNQGAYNHQFATEKFMASIVAKQLENIFNEALGRK